MGRQQPMTGMDDVERQTPHGDTEILDKKTKAARDCRFLCAVLIIVVVFTAGMIFTLEYFQNDMRYFVAIDDSASSDLGTAAEGLSFNVTLGVASRSYGSKACIEPGTYLEVSYRGVQLAASSEVGALCAGPRKSAEQRVAARATAVPVGHVLDRLIVDMNQGAAVFDITLHVGGGDGWMSGCKGNRVGAAAVWCNAPSQEPTL